MSNRRRFLQQVGKTAGLVVVGASAKSLLVGCAGNVGNSPTESSVTAQIPSTGLATPGTVQWGAEATSGAPYVFSDPSNPGQLIGFEVEIATAIAKLMGGTQTMVQTAYPQLPAALSSKKFDFIMNGWEINDDRAKTQHFSEPYYRYGQQIVVRADDERFKDVTATSDFTLKDLAGMTVGTGAGYKAEELLKADTAIKTRPYDGNIPFDEVALKRLDAMMVDYPIVAYYALGSGPGGTENKALKLVGKPIFLNNYVIATNKADPKGAALVAEINQALAILKKDGTLKKIYEHWKMWNEQQAEIGIT